MSFEFIIVIAFAQGMACNLYIDLKILTSVLRAIHVAILNNAKILWEVILAVADLAFATILSHKIAKVILIAFLTFFVVA